MENLKSVVFFNNKGGVGKTTLVCNVASYLALQMGLRVLLVDSDPQCNSTQLVLPTDEWANLYMDTGNSSPTPSTLIDVLQPITDGDASIARQTPAVKGSAHRFGFDLLPGHPRMSIVEDLLSRAWGEALSGDIGGIRPTNWASQFLSERRSRYDAIFFDVGPSLGSLNRTVLLGADYFVTPMGADIFSILGVRNISDWLRSWLDSYITSLTLCETRHPGALDRFQISSSVGTKSGFAGYTVQQYITKSKQGVRRPTQAFERIIDTIPAQIETSLGPFLASGLDLEAAKLGDVPNMFSLTPLAQSVNAPISELIASDGLAGGQYQQQANYVETIQAVGAALARNTGLVSGD